MNIKRKNNETMLINIPDGGAFELLGNYYIRSSKIQDGLVFCVNLESGRVIFQDPHASVTKVDVEVHIV